MPIFVAREWFRHTIGFARNEVSRRYVDTPPELWFPTEFRERDLNLKQGSKETVVENPEVKEIYDQSMRNAEAQRGAAIFLKYAKQISELIEAFPISWKALQ
jgi:thymidylate synthase ThyX